MGRKPATTGCYRLVLAAVVLSSLAMWAMLLSASIWAFNAAISHPALLAASVAIGALVLSLPVGWLLLYTVTTSPHRPLR